MAKYNKLKKKKTQMKRITHIPINKEQIQGNH